MPKHLTEDQVEQFKRDGFIHPMDGLTPAEAQECIECLEDYESRTGQTARDSLTLKSHLPFGLFSRVIRNERVLDAVEDLIGPNILCWGSSFFVKEPHSETFVSWHADTYYYGIEPQETVTAWIAFSPSNLESGCMRCIPGSHKTKTEFYNAPEDLIGPNILCWGSSFFVKEPRSETFVSWHADTYYYGIEPQETVTAWIAFSPSNLESGCMRCIPGSHKTKTEFYNAPEENNILTRGQNTRNVDESKAVFMPLEPGQFSIHQECTVHSSQPNNSDYRRIGYSIHYCPTHVRETMYDPVDGKKSAVHSR